MTKDDDLEVETVSQFSLQIHSVFLETLHYNIVIVC